MAIGDAIRSLRKAHGMTQEQLGFLLGVQKATIQKYEHGVIVNLKKDTIDKLAKIFNINPVTLYGWDEKFNSKKLRTEVLLLELKDEILKLTDDELKTLLTILRK